MRKEVKLIIGFFSLLILPLLILSYYNQPTGDDFWCTWMVKKYGIPATQHKLFVSITGRYSSTLMMSFNTLTFDKLWGFKVMPIIMILGWVTAVFYLLHSFFKRLLTRGQRFLLAIFIVSVYYLNMPDLYEGLYWMSAVICYQVPVVLSLLLVGFIYKRKESSSWWIAILLISVSFFIGGFHELIAFIMTLILVLILCVQWIKTRIIVRNYLLVFTGSVASFLVQFFCIGNRNRVSTTQPEESWSLIQRLYIGFAQTAYHLAKHCLLSPIFWLAIIVVYLLAKEYKNQRTITNIPFSKQVQYVFVLVSFIAVFSPGVLLVIITSNYAPMRVVDLSYTLFVIASIITTIWLAVSKQGYSIDFFLKKSILYIGLPALLLLPINSNLKEVVGPLISGSAKKYNDEVNERFEKIESCSEPVCRINCLIAKPRVLCMVDICNQPTVLQYVEKVFEKRLVVSQQ